MARTPTTHAPDARVPLALALMTALLFARVVGAAFVGYDDPYNVTDNSELRLPLAGSLVSVWTHASFGAYLPVTRTVWTLLWHVTHAPWAFHLLNVLVHLVNVMLVRRLLMRLPLAEPAASVGAALFAWHPLQVEAVAWVTGLKDLLATLFTLLALLALARETDASASRPRPGWSAIALATVMAALAMGSKSSAVTLPALAALVLAWRRVPWRWIAGVALSWSALSAATVAVTHAAEVASGRRFVPTELTERPRIVLDALGFYLTRLVAPFDLSVDHGRSPSWVAAHPGSLAVALLPVALAVAAFAARRRHPWAGWSLAWFAVAIAPVSGVVPFVFQNVSTVGDRYAYPAMIGAAFALGSTWALLTRPPARVGIALALAACAIATVLQLGTWRDDRALLARVLAVNPRSWMAHVNRGSDLGEQGHPEAAIAELRAALALAPDQAEAHANLGNALYLLGRPDSAIAEWRLTLRLLPSQVSARRNLGLVLLEQGRRAEAEIELREALRQVPDDPEVRAALRRLASPAADSAR